MKKISWHAAGLTDCGLVRKHNEDNFSLSSDLRVFVVADGMGGTANGALASKLAVEELADYHKNNRLNFEEELALKEWLCDSITKANQRVVEEQTVTGAQMGTTIVVAVQSDDGKLHIAHVGDSRAYLIRSGVVKALTMDHSVVMEMVRCGKLTKEQCKKSPFKHLITRCLGHEKDVECDYVCVDMQPGDWVILASDGLEAAVEEQDLPAIVQRTSDPAQACSELVDKTLAGGAPDNVTVLTIHYSPVDVACQVEQSAVLH